MTESIAPAVPAAGPTVTAVTARHFTAALGETATFAAALFPDPAQPHHPVEATVVPVETTSAGTADGRLLLRVDAAGSRTDIGIPQDVAARAELTAHLTALENLGRAAGQARAALARHEQEQRAQRTEERRARLEATYARPTAATFGLVDTTTGWTTPAADQADQAAGVRVTLAAEVPSAWNAPRTLVALDVTTDTGPPIGQVRVDVDGNVTTHNPFGTRRPSTDVISREVSRQLHDTDPWSDYPAPPPDASVLEHVATLAGHAADVEPWCAQMAAAFAQVEAHQEQRRAEAAEWARASRSSGRIPTATLTKWMNERSNVDYDSTGYAIGGWRVVAQQVSGRTRPAHLDGTGRGKRAVGVKEILYVARLVHEPVRQYRRDSFGFLTFGQSDIDALRERLPDCEIRVPEDRKAIFVAVKGEEHREALEAAVVEWVLLGE